MYLFKGKIDNYVPETVSSENIDCFALISDKIMIP